MRTTLNHLALCALLTLASISANAAERYVTQTAQADGPFTNVATLVIGQYEVAELASFSASINAGGYETRIDVIKDGRAFPHWVYNPQRWSGGPPRDPVDPLIVAGPAELRLVALPGRFALCTWKILPASYPPDRAVLVAPGTNQTQVTLECSTNLVNWFTATNGIYGPLPEAKFFRIKAEPALPH